MDLEDIPYLDIDLKNYVELAGTLKPLVRETFGF